MYIHNFSFIKLFFFWLKSLDILLCFFGVLLCCLDWSEAPDSSDLPASASLPRGWDKGNHEISLI